MKKLATTLVCVLAAMLFVAGCGSSNKSTGTGSEGTTFRIASQGYAEVEIQAELAKALIEAKTNHKVEHVQNLGSSMANLQATVKGDLDMHISFSGTHFLGTFEQKLTPKWRDPDKVWQYVHDRLLEEYGLYAFEPYGYNNVYGVAIPRATAEEFTLKISDLAPAPVIWCWPRSDVSGLPGQGYKSSVRLTALASDAILMDFGLAYRALPQEQLMLR